MGREEWLIERRNGIGSSDAAAICGVNPYSSAVGVFLEKTGRLPAKEMTEPMRWGLKLEDAIAEAYTETTGRQLVRAEANVRHERHRFMLANVDRETADSERKIVELKAVSVRQAKHWGEAGSDEVPEWYLIQVMHQMIVTGRQLADVVALFGGNELKIYTVPFNPVLADRMIEIEVDFWKHVERDEQPAWDWQHPATPELVNAIYAPGESVVELDEVTAALVANYRHLGDAMSDAKEAREVAKAQIIAAMRDAGAGTLPDGSIVTRKLVSRKAYEVQATQYVDFRVKNPSTKKGARS